MTYLYSAIIGLCLAGALLSWEGRAEQSAVQAAPVVAPSWATDVLHGLGNDAPTEETIAYLEAWHRAEGGAATFNWLNSTEPADGDTCYNYLNGKCGVRNYPDYQSGVDATVETLTNGFYPRTLAGLQANQPTVDDAEMGVWGTGGGAIRAQLGQATDVRGQLVSYALSLQGIPYVRGGRSATGGDCSGTMEHIYLAVTGIDIGGTTYTQWPNLQPTDDPQPGDLAYFAGFSDGDEHVGMVADINGDGALDLINNGGLEQDMHTDYSFMSVPYFADHFKGFRRAL